MPVKSRKSLGVGSRAIRAISHPVRVAIQCILYSRVASPKELADELGEELSDISYHVSNLRENGSIEQVKVEPRRGAVEHYYKAVIPPLHDDASWGKLPLATREEISAVTFQGLAAEATWALNEGTFDERDDRHLSRLPMRLDERGCREALECQAALLERLERIKALAAKRLQKSGEPGKPFLAGVIGVQLPERESQAEGD
jgi:DNA-binding transcriptional ArsR family regulator